MIPLRGASTVGLSGRNKATPVPRIVCSTVPPSKMPVEGAVGHTATKGPQAIGVVSGGCHPEGRVAHQMADQVEPRRRRVTTQAAEEMVDLRAGQPKEGTATRIPEGTVETHRMTQIVEVPVTGTHSWADS